MIKATKQMSAKKFNASLPNSLRFQIIFSLAVTLAIATTVTLLITQRARAQALTRATQDALAVVDTAASEYGLLLENTRQLLSTVAEIPAVTAMEQGCHETLATIAQTSARYTGIFVMDRAGDSRCSSLPMGGSTINNADLRYFQEVISTGGFSVGDYLIGRRSGKPIVVGAAPAYDSAGDLSAVVAAGIDLAYLATLEKLLPISKDATFLLIDPSQKILVGDGAFWQTGQALAQGRLKSALTPLQRGVTEDEGPNGKPYLFTFAPILEGTPIMAVVAQEKASVTTPFVRPLELMTIGILFFGAFLIALAMWQMQRLLLSPLAKLKLATEQLGTGDLAVRVGTDYPDELNSLANHFDQMVTSLEQRKKERDHAEHMRERYALELERSNKDLERFAYAASHDLREPLRMVTSYVQLLEKRYADKLDDKAKSFIGYAVDGTARMRNLIDALLSLARVANQTTQFEPTACDTVVKNALENLSVAIKESGAVITSKALPKIMGDKTQLLQLFQNLIGNAIKFRAEAPPKVYIDARDSGGTWTFSVSDNGIGIEPEMREQIFEIFQRLHTRDKYEGTGIGLALCRKIVEGHGGQIFVTNSAEGGTTFAFTLPKLS